MKITIPAAAGVALALGLIPLGLGAALLAMTLLDKGVTLTQFGTDFNTAFSQLAGLIAGAVGLSYVAWAIKTIVIGSVRRQPNHNHSPANAAGKER